MTAAGHAPGDWKASSKGDVLQLLQNGATRAWNLHIALYYKAGGTPWPMLRRDSDLSTRYVGVSFYWSTDGEELNTARRPGLQRARRWRRRPQRHCEDL